MKHILIALGLFCLTGCQTVRVYRFANMEKSKQLLILKNDQAVVGVMPEVGGRIVLYRLTDGINVLFSDPDSWGDKGKKVAPYRPYYGHTIWVGPQLEWWAEMKKDSERAAGSAPLTPDQAHSASKHLVVSKSNTFVRLVGPEIKEKGIQLTKEVLLENDGKVKLKTIVTNITKKPVSWDICSNTRVPGAGTAYVPMCDEFEQQGDPCKLRVTYETKDPDQTRAMPPRTINQVFFFDSEKALDHFDRRYISKAYVYYPHNSIYVFYDDYVFVKHAERLRKSDPKHPHAPVEVCQLLDPAKPEQNMIELEMHGPLLTIAPGQAITFEETWSLSRFNGIDDHNGHVQYIRSRMKPE